MTRATKEKRKDLDKLKRAENRLIKKAAKQGMTITRDDGFSLEDCKYLASHYSNAILELAQRLIDEESLHYTDEWIRAVKEEIETRIVEKALLGVKKR